jgi:hypothetical protein
MTNKDSVLAALDCRVAASPLLAMTRKRNVHSAFRDVNM